MFFIEAYSDFENGRFSERSLRRMKMIKVVFTYKTKTEDLPELMHKFSQSADPKFHSEVGNIKIERFKRIVGEYTYIVLDIYYNSEEDYNARTAFERSQSAWNGIWFNPKNKHEEVSVEIFDVF